MIAIIKKGALTENMPSVEGFSYFIVVHHSLAHKNKFTDLSEK